MRMKNDIAFVLDFRMNLFEHQSSDNANMPLRGLLYFARQYEKYVSKKEFNMFGSKVIPLPTPQYVVFYNGNSWNGERKILKLSDSFANREIKGCMEIEVLQLNINYGHNKEIMEKCKVLGEYAVFVNKVKTYSETYSIEEAVDRAVDECIEEGILKRILIEHRAEVKDMLLTEYDEEKVMRLFQKEYEEEAAEKVAKAEAKVAKAESEVAKATKRAEEAEMAVAIMQKENEQTKKEIEMAEKEINALKKELEQYRNNYVEKMDVM